MKDSLIVLGFFVGGCLLGALGYLPVDLKTGNMSIYILYALMFQIGISIDFSAPSEVLADSVGYYWWNSAFLGSGQSAA